MDREKPVLNVKSLKEQVYDFLREQMRRGKSCPARSSTWKKPLASWG